MKVILESPRIQKRQKRWYPVHRIYACLYNHLHRFLFLFFQLASFSVCFIFFLIYFMFSFKNTPALSRSISRPVVIWVNYTWTIQLFEFILCYGFFILVYDACLFILM